MRRLDGRLCLRQGRKVRAPQGSVTGNARHLAFFNARSDKSHRDEFGKRCSNVTA